MANNLFEMMGTSLDKVKELAGTETVIGDPITTPNGTMIIPVSKIAMGFASGGIDYAAKQTQKVTKTDHFGGGGGTGVTVTPIAFLIIKPDGKIDLVPIEAPKNTDTVDKVTAFIERTPDILERIKEIFLSDEKETAQKNSDKENGKELVKEEPEKED